jgi:hypothetical protein
MQIDESNTHSEKVSFSIGERAEPDANVTVDSERHLAKQCPEIGSRWVEGRSGKLDADIT